jgi:hypothetical protein
LTDYSNMAEVYVIEAGHMEVARPEAGRQVAGYFDDVHRI